MYACDFSETAISTLKSDIRYSNDARGIAFQHDITNPIPSSLIADHSIDIVTMIFVLSAIPPTNQAAVFSGLKRILKPNTGIVLYRRLWAI